MFPVGLEMYHCKKCEKKKNKNPLISTEYPCIKYTLQPMEKERTLAQGTPNSVYFISWDKWLKHPEGLNYE